MISFEHCPDSDLSKWEIPCSIRNSREIMLKDMTPDLKMAEGPIEMLTFQFKSQISDQRIFKSIFFDSIFKL